jgi:hypothetical protein
MPPTRRAALATPLCRFQELPIEAAYALREALRLQDDVDELAQLSSRPQFGQFAAPLTPGSTTPTKAGLKLRTPKAVPGGGAILERLDETEA